MAGRGSSAGRQEGQGVLPVPDELLGSRLRASSPRMVWAASPARKCLAAVGQQLAYMVPNVMESGAALPRTSSGKIDRAGLAGHGA